MKRWPVVVIFGIQHCEVTWCRWLQFCSSP